MNVNVSLIYDSSDDSSEPYLFTYESAFQQASFEYIKNLHQHNDPRIRTMFVYISISR